jgi:Family of unknown function (DUF5908)
MPIEVRELIIKTTIESNSDKKSSNSLSNDDVQTLKRRILKECKDLIKKESKQITDR